MGRETGIQWTDATWNPWWGCTKVSPGCDNCYAEGLSKRFAPGMWGVDGSRREFDAAHFREPLNWNRKAMRDGKVMRVFSGSMCDVFENHPIAEKYRPQLFALIMQTPWLQWQLLTKRAGNISRMVPESWMTHSWPRNAWIGATVVNQEEADRDIPKLLQLSFQWNGILRRRSPVLFLSCEPLLGPVDIRKYMGACTCNFETVKGAWTHSAMCPATGPRIDWVICGGESGNRARPMKPAWARALRDQCAAAGVPFFFKQWGNWVTEDQSPQDIVLPGTSHCPWATGQTESGRWRGDHTSVYNVGKSAAGRLLDGIEHNAFPEVP